MIKKGAIIGGILGALVGFALAAREPIAGDISVENLFSHVITARTIIDNQGISSSLSYALKSSFLLGILGLTLGALASLFIKKMIDNSRARKKALSEKEQLTKKAT